MTEKKKEKEYEYYGRDLDNYKKLHKATAETKGKLKEFMAASTLTQAKKLLWGIKKKKFSCCTKGCYQCNGTGEKKVKA